MPHITTLPLHEPVPSCIAFEHDFETLKRSVSSYQKAYDEMQTMLDQRIMAYQRANGGRSFWQDEAAQQSSDNRQLIEAMNRVQPRLMEMKQQLKEQKQDMVFYEIQRALNKHPIICHQESI
jgi:virulence-associated protein VapD